MFSRLACATLAVSVWPAISMAQAQVPPPTAIEIAVAHARADSVIAAASADAHFDNVTTGGVPTVRHKASGMTCVFTDEAYDSITVYPESEGLASGENVGCNTRMLDVDFSNYATRYAQRYDERFILEDAARAIVHRWPDASPHDGELVAASMSGGPEPVVTGYDIEIRGVPMLTLAFVSHQDDWSFKGRVTGPGDDRSTQTNVLGATTFLMALPGNRD